jgi:UDP-N-acetylmuramate-alanine ligase
VAHLRQTLRAGDVVLTLGAGDITTLGDDLVQHLVPVRAAG